MWMSPERCTREIEAAAARTLRSGTSVPTLAALLRGSPFAAVEYRPDPSRPVASWPEVTARGFGACADAAALALAVGRRRGLDVVLVYDEAKCPDGQYHVVAVVDGQPIDPWPLPRVCRSRSLSTVVVNQE